MAYNKRSNNFNKKNDKYNKDKREKTFTSHDRRDFDKAKKIKEEQYSNQDEGLQIEGRNAMLEALDNDKYFDKILIKNGEITGTLKVIIAKAIEKGIIIQEVPKFKLDEVSETEHHQGVIGICPAHEYASVEDMLVLAKSKNEPPFLIILDEITDPHNLGAIIRTAEACGAHGVIIPKRNAVGLTGVVSKASAGAIEHVMVSRVTNIVSTIEMLKKRNIWVACADMQGQSFYDADLKGAIAIVVGNEGKGVSKLVRQKCDFSVKIPMMGKIDSLNVSVATGIVLYEVLRERKGKK